MGMHLSLLSVSPPPPVSLAGSLAPNPSQDSDRRADVGLSRALA